MMRRKNSGLKIFFCSLFLFLTNPSVLAAEIVKEPHVAGAFYPGEAEELSRAVDGYLKKAETVSVSGEPFVLIVPHAGYIYSGPVAAYGYKAVEGRRYDLVVILAPSHYFPFRGVSVFPSGSFQTPLGRVYVDENVSLELLAGGQDLVVARREYFEREHSLEVQLPFLQKVLAPGFKVLPLIMGDMNYDECSALASLLIKISEGRKILVVASTDLSHFKNYEEALGYDGKTIDFLKNMDSRGLWDAVSGTGWNVCGIRPVVAALLFAKMQGEDHLVVAKYSNSGDTAGDKSRVVGYVSAWVTKNDPSLSQNKSLPVQAQEPQSGEETMLTDTDRKKLLEIARETIAAKVSGKPLPRFLESSPGLNRKNGVFVTLRKQGELRGCIGLFTSDEPLYKSVQDMAVSSSSQDYRFPPVAADELSQIKIEISVLTEPRLIDDWRKIRMGSDGVIVRKGFSSGVFLPQVATETGWDRETFLRELCWQKAGLPPDAYKDPDTKLYVFQAIIFSEEE